MYKREQYKNHPLFEHCIGIDYPVGWSDIVHDFVEWIEKYNIENKCFFGFAQIKTKFGKLTIYMQDYTASWDNPACWSNDTDKHIANINKVINKIATSAEKTCSICGKQKEKIVINTKIKSICFDHPKELWRKEK
tara:strand:+ start:3918 stop:4322 length:405 start_codon:yes stop_codon:yes gene_type:complete